MRCRGTEVLQSSQLFVTLQKVRWRVCIGLAMLVKLKMVFVRRQVVVKWVAGKIGGRELMSVCQLMNVVC